MRPSRRRATISTVNVPGGRPTRLIAVDRCLPRNVFAFLPSTSTTAETSPSCLAFWMWIVNSRSLVHVFGAAPLIASTPAVGVAAVVGVVVVGAGAGLGSGAGGTVTVLPS